MVTISQEGTVTTTDGLEKTVFEKTGTKFFGGRIDLSPIVGGDDFTFRTFYKFKSAGAYVLEHPTTIKTVPVDKSLEVAMRPSAYGFKVTVQRNSVTDRSFDFIFFVGG